MTKGPEIGEEATALAVELLSVCRERGDLIATAESCTGGLLAATMTAIPGCSDCFERGFVTYSNRSKSEMLGVPFWLIEKHGAVSEDVARAMAGGALIHSPADLAVAITGIAGPGGGSPAKPVGTVVFARAERDADPAKIVADQKLFEEKDRAGVRLQAALCALDLLMP